MFDFDLTTQVSEGLTLGNTLIIIFSALVLGLIISLAYIFTHRDEGYSGSFTVTLIMLPAIIAMIILLIGNNVARAFSLAGAFSLIRFRSEAGDPKDISYVFFTLGVGLACGMGYIVYGIIFSVIMCAVMIILYFLKFPKSSMGEMQLKITIPENVDYYGLFDDILEKYSNGFKFQRVKSADFGTLFEVCYKISLKDNTNHKKFLDELRCRNNNLNIVLSCI